MSSNWRLTQKLLQATLLSVSRQTYEAARVLIVCHDRPELGRHSSSIVELMEASFPPPVDRVASQMRQDKEGKLAAGTRRLLECGCDWIMKLDADDLIAQQTCKFIENSDSDAVIFRRGIVRLARSNWHLLETKKFFRICGSSIAFHRRLLVPELEERALALFHCFVSDNHERIEEWCGEHSASVSYPPFAAACYVQSSDLRLSRFYHPNHRLTVRELIGWLRRVRRTTRAVRDEFAIDYES